MVANFNTMMTDGGGGGNVGTADSFIVKPGVISAAVSKYGTAKTNYDNALLAAEKDFEGIEWTDDNGLSFQDAVKKFREEADKVSERLKTNSNILNACLRSAEDVQATVRSNINSAFDVAK